MSTCIEDTIQERGKLVGEGRRERGRGGGSEVGVGRDSQKREGPSGFPLSLRWCGKEHGGNKTYCEFIIPIWLALAQASLLVIDQLSMSLSASVACLVL